MIQNKNLIEIWVSLKKATNVFARIPNHSVSKFNWISLQSVAISFACAVVPNHNSSVYQTTIDCGNTLRKSANKSLIRFENNIGWYYIHMPTCVTCHYIWSKQNDNKTHGHRIHGNFSCQIYLKLHLMHTYMF